MIATLEEVKNLLKKPNPLVIAGKKESLEKLPPGNWIGGTVPFLIQDRGEELKQDYFDVTQIPASVSKVTLKTYNLKNIHLVKHDAYTGGFSIIILPAKSALHHSFAMNSRDYPGCEKASIVGWVSGFLEKDAHEAWVSFGPKASHSMEIAVVMHCQLKEGYRSKVKCLKVFEAGDGPLLEFPESGFNIKQVFVNSELQSFAEYIKKQEIDMRQPLIAVDEEDWESVAFRKIKEDEVQLYAPVFKYKQYRIAKAEQDYHKNLMDGFQKVFDDKPPLFACNCLLNYRYNDLEGKDIGNLRGPVTFGEIACNLHNQTFIALSIEATPR